MDALAFWGLLPVSALQGLALRRQALRLEPPPGPMSGQAGTGEPLRLVALGDSIIAGVGAGSRDETLAAQLARELSGLAGRSVAWHADGTSGLAIADLIASVASRHPDAGAGLVLISIGVNDVTSLTTTRRWRRQIDQLARLLRQRFPEALVVFAGLPPMQRFPLPPQPLRYCLGLRAHRLDTLLAASLSGHAGMMHVPTRIDPARHGFCADGFHPSSEAYASWASELAALVLPHLQQHRAGVQPSASQSRGTR